MIDTSLRHAPLINSPALSPGRPEVEWWTVGQDRFESTSALLAAAPRLGTGHSATYHYFASAAAATPEALARSTISNTAQATIVGTVLGAVAGGALMFALGPTAEAILTAVALSAASGLCGAVFAYTGSKEYEQQGNVLTGTLRADNGLVFHTADGQHVDLDRYARCGDNAASPWWQRRDEIPIIPFTAEGP